MVGLADMVLTTSGGVELATHGYNGMPSLPDKLDSGVRYIGNAGAQMRQGWVLPAGCLQHVPCLLACNMCLACMSACLPAFQATGWSGRGSRSLLGRWNFCPFAPLVSLSSSSPL